MMSLTKPHTHNYKTRYLNKDRLIQKRTILRSTKGAHLKIP